MCWCFGGARLSRHRVCRVGRRSQIRFGSSAVHSPSSRAVVARGKVNFFFLWSLKRATACSPGDFFCGRTTSTPIPPAGPPRGTPRAATSSPLEVGGRASTPSRSARYRVAADLKRPATWSSGVFSEAVRRAASASPTRLRCRRRSRPWRI